MDMVIFLKKFGKKKIEIVEMTTKHVNNQSF
jgi:hypothetical protein